MACGPTSSKSGIHGYWPKDLRSQSHRELVSSVTSRNYLQSKLESQPCCVLAQDWVYGHNPGRDLTKKLVALVAFLFFSAVVTMVI